MPIIEIAKIQIRRGQENQGQVPQLAPGEMAWAEDTQNLYIGKRISEGANSDANTRILTDKDYTNILQQAISEAAIGASQNFSISSTSTAYRFKNYIPYNNLGITGTTYATINPTFATKLDNWVSLTDFAPGGIWPPPISNDITSILQQAIGLVGVTPTRNGGGVVFQNGTVDMPVASSYTTAAVQAGFTVSTITVYNAGNIVLNTQVVGPSFRSGTYITGIVNSGTTAVVTLSTSTIGVLNTTTVAYTALASTATVGTSTIYVVGTGGIGIGSQIVGTGFDPATTATTVRVGTVTTVTLSTRMIATSAVPANSSIQFVNPGTSIQFINSPSGYTFNPTLGPLAIKVPAGTWNISSPVLLPPYTTLIGEGANMTTLTYSGIINNGDPMFKTVDAYGVPFEGLQLVTIPPSTRYQSHVQGKNPGNVTIKNMTLSVANVGNTLTNNAIVSLDNASNVLFDNVYIGNMSNASTITPGLIVGVQIRTDQALINKSTMALSDNLQFNNCWINGIAVGIKNTGTVNRAVIQNSKFTSLINGIQSYNFLAPSMLNGLATDNRFEDIAQEAVIMGVVNAGQYVPSLQQDTYFISQNNAYTNVGNGFQGESYQLTPVLRNYDYGLTSVNDYFDRTVNPASTATENVHWLSQRISAKSNILYSKNIPALLGFYADPPYSSTTSQYSSILNIPMTSGNSSAAFIDYSIVNDNVARKGKLIVNVSTAGTYLFPDGWADVSDYYTYFDRGQSGVSGSYQWTTELIHAQPAIRVGNVFAYNNGSLPLIYQTGTNTLDVLMNNQRYYSTATITTSRASNPDFFTYSSPGSAGTSVTFSTPFGSPPTFTDGTNTATLLAATFSGFANTVLTCQFGNAADGSPKIIRNLTTGTAIIFENPPLITWGNGTPTTFDYYANQDSNVTLYTPSFITSATIGIFRNGQEIGVTPVTGEYTYTANGYTIYQFGFTPRITTQIQPQDQVFLTFYPSQFYNYVTLSLYNTDVVTLTPTTVRYTIDYQT
jgi:hypothetical protein